MAYVGADALGHFIGCSERLDALGVVGGYDTDDFGGIDFQNGASDTVGS